MAAPTPLAIQTITRTGITPTYSGANADGHTVANDGRVVLNVLNTDGSPVDVTIDTPNTVDGLAIDQRTVTVGATTGNKFIGPFPTNTYGASMTVTFSDVTGLTIAALKVVTG